MASAGRSQVIATISHDTRAAFALAMALDNTAWVCPAEASAKLAGPMERSSAPSPVAEKSAVA